MSSPVSPLSDIDPAAITARPSYEAFLRIKQGIGSEALRAAGLPPVENLSYDAYVAALNRKAAAARVAEQPRPAKAVAEIHIVPSRAAEAKRLAWTSLVVVPVALVAVILVINMFKSPAPNDGPNASEAVAAPLMSDGLTSDGIPVALSLTAVDDMPPLVLPADDAAASEPPARFDNEVAAVEPAAEKVELLPVTKAAAATGTEQVPVQATKKKKAAATRETAQAPSQAAVMPVQERRTATQSEKKAATPARKVAKKDDDFWQPLVDLLDGKGIRGARNVPPPEDRVGR